MGIGGRGVIMSNLQADEGCDFAFLADTSAWHRQIRITNSARDGQGTGR
jgi:hypothetical protein